MNGAETLRRLIRRDRDDRAPPRAIASAWSGGRLHAISPGQKGPKRLEVSEGHQNEEFRSSPGDPTSSSRPVAQMSARPGERPALGGEEARAARRGTHQNPEFRSGTKVPNRRKYLKSVRSGRVELPQYYYHQNLNNAGAENEPRK